MVTQISILNRGSLFSSWYVCISRIGALQRVLQRFTDDSFACNKLSETSDLR